MAIDWRDSKGQKFFVAGTANAFLVEEWCKNNINEDKWSLVGFADCTYIHLFETEDIIVFKLRFASIYKYADINWS